MAHIIEMPKLSDTMEEGGIAEWLKEEGDFVEEGEVFVSIETDKAAMEYASPEEGYLLKILLPAGSSASLNTPIAVLGEKGETFDESKLKSAAKSSEDSDKVGAADKSEKRQKSAKTQPEASADKNGAKEASSLATSEGSARIKASPLAKKLARSKGIDLKQVSGSGPYGRVVLRDLEGVDAGLSTAAAPVRSRAGGGRATTSVNLSMMRKTIAKRLSAAKNDAPHFYLTVSANMQRMLSWRQELNTEGSQVKVSVNDLVMLAVSKALMKHPEVNSSWMEDHILQHHYVDLSMAVALPTGLVTPVIHNCHELGVREIAQHSKAMAKKAVDGLLKPEEYQGGTFTVSNLGMTRIESFTAIINPPQSCILAVGTIVKTPTVDEHDRVTVSPIMKMTLSCDHRAVDGMVGAQFLDTLVKYLENPVHMLA